MKKKILILGYGYTAQHLTELLLEKNYSVTATVRNSTRVTLPSSTEPRLIPFKAPEIAASIKDASHILVSIPPDNNGDDPAFSLIKTQLLDSKSTLKWLGYLSSTSVYGDHNGRWVNEDSILNSASIPGVRRIKAEKKWLSLHQNHSLPVNIFRLSGIYGTNRNCVEKIIAGKRHSIIKKGHFFSRIHVTVIARALYESMNCPTPGEIYNLADNLPCETETVDSYAAKLLNRSMLKSVSYEHANNSPQLKRFYSENKRVSNQKFMNHFNFQLRYPSYKEGLSSLYEALKYHSDMEKKS